ncbi:hypothetical protein RUND412_006867 [Rhizina undulata]
MRPSTLASICALVLGAATLLPIAGANPLYRVNFEQDKNGGVASEVKTCSQVGIDLMKSGGNAADAMVGTAICVGVLGMYHSGLGGGGFMIVRLSNGTYDTIDFRETAPAAATEDMYTNNTELSLTGGLASGVPGYLRGLERLHDLYGKLPWRVLFKPSIKLAREGFKVFEDLVSYMDSSSGPFPFLVEDPSWALDFAPNGTRVGLGDIMYRKRYADTLEEIANKGADAFYTGAIANTTITALQNAGGTMTLEDLKNYTVVHREALHIDYKGYGINSVSAPASGAAMLAALKTIEGYDQTTAGLNLSTHHLVEAFKFAYGQRSLLGDPAFVTGATEYEKEMISAATAAEVRELISNTGVLNLSQYDPQGLESLETPGTSHMVTVDKSGLAVSLTTTINLLFGSGIMVPETGVIMNDEMNDFSIPGSSNAFGYIPSEANFIRPGKRPLSSISATIIDNPNGTVYYLIGAAGGSRIITATAQNIWHVIDHGFTVPEALAQPRLHDQLVPLTTSFEWAYDNSTVDYLKSLGHNVSWIGPGQSTAQGIRVLPNGTIEAAGEPRQKSSGGIAF